MYARMSTIAQALPHTPITETDTKTDTKTDAKTDTKTDTKTERYKKNDIPYSQNFANYLQTMYLTLQTCSQAPHWHILACLALSCHQVLVIQAS